MRPVGQSGGLRPEGVPLKREAPVLTEARRRPRIPSPLATVSPSPGGNASRAIQRLPSSPSSPLRPDVPLRYRSRHARKEGRFKCFSYDDLVKRDKVNLDLLWLKDEALEESANLPAPGVIAVEIAEDIRWRWSNS